MSKVRYVHIEDKNAEVITEWCCTGCDELTKALSLNKKYKTEINKLARRIKKSIADDAIQNDEYHMGYTDAMHEVLAMIKELKREIRDE